MKTQTCNKCLEELSLDRFEWQAKRPNPRKTCKTCRTKGRDFEKEAIRHRAYMKEQRLKNPERLRRNWERSTYGACKEDFNYSECAICGSTEKLCIDHNHATGEVRGLLCNLCNFALGHFQDSTIKMRKAIEYLENPPEWQKPSVAGVKDK